ncbi:RnfABCDGE type electron transport complex subunit B [Methylobacter tundripaludum]|uniref:Electron transport complex, RnfABCDGE type, B subunit n=1 Tax=Methylobacter tundripaludum (strain ATCC BAA-1195 / DSM 17260 / SV96) TaxID=697282 RepID=G3IWD1_METTV|nr:electron transport complex, RnfABCDGE type, B subunit [Methylobacter tundripaludum SV96]
MPMFENPTLIDRINALLPQTQCGQCSFQGCRPYAEAIASGVADINQCPPGGDEGIRDLADLLGVSPKPLNTEFGLHKPPSVAFIIEEDCIGCVKCIADCPVDAIVGAAKLMHTVIASECTGCELCIAPCPVDCIIMQAAPPNNAEKTRAQKSAQAKRRYDARCSRKEQEEAEKAERVKKKKQAFLKMQAAKK